MTETLELEQPVVKRGPGRPRKVQIELTQVKPVEPKITKVEEPLTLEKYNLSTDKTIIGKSIVIYQKEANYGYRSTLCTLYPSPTANCQIWSIAAAVNIFNKPKNSAIDILFLMWEQVRKNMLLIDVKSMYEKNVEAIFDNKLIMSKTNYRSTYGTDMTLYLLDTRHCLNNTLKSKLVKDE